VRLWITPLVPTGTTGELDMCAGTVRRLAGSFLPSKLRRFGDLVRHRGRIQGARVGAFPTELVLSIKAPFRQHLCQWPMKRSSQRLVMSY